MTGPDHIAIFDLLVGAFIVCAILLRAWLGRLGVPSLVGFVILGFFLRVGNDAWAFISPEGLAALDFLASIGVFVLLFRVGLESNLHDLLGKLPRAAPIWMGDVTISAVPAFLLMYFGFELAIIPSILVATALTATSVAVSAEAWREAGALTTANGETLVDVAELDDLSGVALLALVLAVVPALRDGHDDAIAPVVTMTVAVTLFKVVGFAFICYLVARVGERHLSQALTRTGEPDSILIVVGVGLLIATVSVFLGLSMAIGALFAGLIFSRNPKAVRLETLFLPLHALFAPFFFIAIGFRIDPGSLQSALGLGGALLVVAIAGKIVGAGSLAAMSVGWAGGILIGVSMVPRAEIAMVIARRGQELGDWAMPAEVFASLAMISLATCIISPFAIRWMIRKFPNALG